jgi:hypothetical protein
MQKNHRLWAQARTVLLAAFAASVMLPFGVGSSLALGATAHRTMPSAAISCTAKPTSRYPVDDSSVGIRISTSARAHFTVKAHFRGGVREKKAVAGATGTGTATFRLGGATPGYRVAVDVSVALGDRHGSCTTWFRPRKKVKHRHPAAAWCTATASVYNAAYDWNNVYVHSNQPYKDATASADGYSWSYETNGSGYALIYLNGPPAGVEITVTVGGATCYTSD